MRNTTTSPWLWRVVALTLLMLLAPTASAAAGECRLNTGSVAADSAKIFAFDRRVTAMNNMSGIDAFIGERICQYDNFFRYFTEEPDYGYVGCFSSQEKADSFWSSDSDEGAAFMARMHHDCVKWASQRYQPVTGRIEKNIRRRAAADESASKQAAMAITKAKAKAEKQAKIQAQAEARASVDARVRQRASALRTAIESAGVAADKRVVWKTTVAKTSSATRLDREIASYLFSLEIGNTPNGASDGGEINTAVQEKLAGIFGAALVESVDYDAEEESYRLHLAASGVDYGLDVKLRARPGMEQTLAGMAGYLVFVWKDPELTPQLLVLHSDELTLTGEIVSASPIRRVEVARDMTVLHGGAPGYQLTIRCSKHGSGVVKSLRQCLKKDGLIAVLQNGKPTLLGYPELAASEKQYRQDLDASFKVFVRTGGGNRMGLLSISIKDGSSENATTIFSRDVLGARQVLFLGTQ